MLPLNNLSRAQLRELRIACSYLFSPEHAKDDEFFKKIKFESVKNAFREKAKRYHPDHHVNETGDMIKKRRERFVKIKESYEIVKSCILEKERSVSDPVARQRKIIAVGGAKGGIGKSIFAANLGVFLSSRGLRTVLVDLDLGGANLHLYVGETYLKYNINDFLNKRIQTLKEIMIASKYGPYLIGGDSSQLGNANINFSRKLKLLRAIKAVDADYIILDLGGDTAFNVVDFFLTADHGLVLTTCDPASYLEAYNFIKVAIYRRLNRIFGPESKFRIGRDSDLKQLINDATISCNGNRVKRIDELITRIKKRQLGSLSLIKRVLKTFQPRIIVNMNADESNIKEVANRIQDVSQRMLSIEVGYLGSIPYQQKIKKSAMELVPVVARYPNGILCRRIRQMIDKMEN